MSKWTVDGMYIVRDGVPVARSTLAPTVMSAYEVNQFIAAACNHYSGFIADLATSKERAKIMNEPMGQLELFR